MKKNTHPEYYTDAKVICACGNTFTTGSTVKELHVEICSACHPFYTGKQKLVDTARRVEKYQAKVAQKGAAAGLRKGKKAKKEKMAIKKSKLQTTKDKK